MAETREVIILGAGGTGRDALEYLAPGYRCLGFLDDDRAKWDARVDGLPVLGPLSRATEWPDALFVNALGSPRTYRGRPAVTGATGVPAGRFVSLIHPTASVSARSEIGRGVIIYPHVVVGARARLGDFVTVLANSVINHDVVLGSWTIVASGVNLAGSVEVGVCCYLGSGATIREHRRIGAEAMIGMGAVVLRDVPAGATAVGNPARLLAARSEELNR